MMAKRWTFYVDDVTIECKSLTGDPLISHTTLVDEESYERAIALMPVLVEAAGFMAEHSWHSDRQGRCTTYLHDAAREARALIASEGAARDKHDTGDDDA